MSHLRPSKVGKTFLGLEKEAHTGEVIDKLKKEHLANQLRFVLGLGLVVFPIIEIGSENPVRLAENENGYGVTKAGHNQFPRAIGIVLSVGAKKTINEFPHEDDDDDGAGCCDGE